MLLATKAIFLCLFFLLPIIFRNILTIPLLIRNTRLILAPAIPTAAPVTVVNEPRETPLRAPEKTS